MASSQPLLRLPGDIALPVVPALFSDLAKELVAVTVSGRDPALPSHSLPTLCAVELPTTLPASAAIRLPCEHSGSESPVIHCIWDNASDVGAARRSIRRI